MFTEQQLKDLIVFNAFRAMQMELLAAAHQASAQTLAGQVQGLQAQVEALKPQDPKTAV